jgi:hypothetical protein
MDIIPTEIQAKAAAIQGALAASSDAIRDDGTVTPEGRVQRLAKLYLQASAEMNTLRETWQGTSTTATETTERDVFGAASISGMDAISYRDAADRASRSETPRDALELLEQAERTGDEVLARAVAQHAFDQPSLLGGTAPEWLEVIDAYAVTRPDVMSKLAELDVARRESLQAGLHTSAIFYVSVPQELAAYTDTRIAVIAETPIAAPTQARTQLEINRAIGRSIDQTGYGWGAP